jgi:3,4-dihydroxy-2-butanone 4-phosphate synthase
MNILIPMAGSSKKFKDTGYTLPKPLIDVDGKPMIQRVIENLPIKGDYFFIIQKSDNEKYHITTTLENIMKYNKFKVIEIVGPTEGQAVTALYAKEFINNNEQLLIVNSDNYFVWDIEHFIKELKEFHDGMIFTFKDDTGSPNWCYAKIDENNYVESLIEKVPVSEHALAGAFYWQHGSQFVSCAEKMIEKNIRTNNEFYIGPVFNEAIKDGLKIYNYKLFDMKSMSTPKDLEEFLKWVEIKKMSVKINDILLNYNRHERDLRMIRTNKMKNVIEDIKRGKPVIVIDDYDRENEGDIVIAAEMTNKENIAFGMKYARGLMCVPATAEIIDRLKLNPMVENSTDRNGTPFTVSVDAIENTTTGMSVYDKLKTISVILDENSKPEDLARPGHLFPLRAKNNLLKERRGHTEASIELMKLAELKPVAIIIEIMNDDGTMAKGEDLDKFAIMNGLTIISVEEIYESAYNTSI